MAKISKSVSFKNATINLEDNTITEITKDYEKVYNLSEILDAWNGVKNISFSIKQDDEMPTNND